MEMPPRIPRRSLVVLAAMASPSGTENVTRTGRSVTSARAAPIIRRGTGLMAGSPTASPSPGLVIVPTPGPAAELVRETRGVEVAAGAVSAGGQGRSHQDENRGPGSCCGQVPGQAADRRRHDQLVGPAGPHHDHGGRVAVVATARAQQLLLELAGAGAG